MKTLLFHSLAAITAAVLPLAAADAAAPETGDAVDLSIVEARGGG
jgi:hypothetical protein